MDFIRIPNDFHMNSILIPYGFHMDSIWNPRMYLYEPKTDSIFVPYGFREDFIWITYVLHMNSIWGLRASFIYNMIDLLPYTIFLALAELEESFRQCAFLTFFIHQISCHIRIFRSSRKSDIRLGSVCFLHL